MKTDIVLLNGGSSSGKTSIATARADAGIILDEVFLSGAASQRRVRTFLDGLRVLWVGVHCRSEVAAIREAGRPERNIGMARAQAEVVHAGVEYDLTVDTSQCSAAECARIIAGHVDG
ncbi:MAG: phosphotransferase-like protein [Jatrophihabitans sp.]